MPPHCCTPSSRAVFAGQDVASWPVGPDVLLAGQGSNLAQMRAVVHQLEAGKVLSCPVLCDGFSPRPCLAAEALQWREAAFALPGLFAGLDWRKRPRRCGTCMRRLPHAGSSARGRPVGYCLVGNLVDESGGGGTEAPSVARPSLLQMRTACG